MSSLWVHDPEFAILSFLIFLGKIVKHIQYDQEAKAWGLAVCEIHCHMFFIVCLFSPNKIIFKLIICMYVYVLKLIYLCVCVCCLSMYVHNLCSVPMSIKSSETRVINGCEHYGCRRRNLGPLQEQQVLFSTESSLQL